MNAVLVPLRELTPETLDALAKNNMRALKYIPETDELLFVVNRQLRVEPTVPPGMPTPQQVPVQEV